MSRAPGIALIAAGLLAACAGLLGVRTSPERAFPHRTHAVEGIACVSCHRSVAQGTTSTALDLPEPAGCLSCHAEPHDRRPCGTCHGRVEHRERVAQAKEHLRFSHRDHQETTQGRCTRCHEGVLSDDAALRPSMATCLSCHEHRQEWDARACSPCHVRMESEGTRPQSHVVHGRDFMLRHGQHAAGARDLCSSCHAESECAECHATNAPVLPATRHFDAPGRAELHPAGFLARHSSEARIDPALCTSCHADERSCRDCHARQGLLSVSSTRASPHEPGWVGTPGSGNRHGSEARRNPLSCASCHGGAGEALCVGCHRVGGAGGNPHGPGFASGKEMSELPCRACHGATR
jgi:hypothetical protein